MKRFASATVMLAGLVAACVLVGGPPPLRAQPAGGAAPLARGWGRLVASGTLVAADLSSGTVTLAIAGTGQLETNAGGTAWQQKPLGGTHPVRLLPTTLVLDADAHPVAPAAVRTGAPVSLWAAVRPDAAILALILQITSPRPRSAAAPRPDDSPAASAPGVVVQRSGPVLTMLTPTGAKRNVVLTAATTVRLGGRSGAVAAIAPYDVLRVEGPVNSDGSLAATRIDVEFGAATAAQISGPVEESLSGLGGLVVAGTMIATFAGTYVVRRSERATFAQILTGGLITVYGSMIAAGSTPVGLEARVIVVR